MKLIGSVLILMLSSGLIAQKKVFFEPYLGFYVGNYKSVDSVNQKQNLISTSPFRGKDFAIGGRFNYTNYSISIAVGVESAYFTSGFKHIEPDIYPKVDSYESSSQGNSKSFYGQFAYHLFDFNLKKPRWFAKKSAKPYLMVSRINPFVGFEYWVMTNSFINDEIEYNSSITTSSGTITGSRQYHSYSKTNPGLRLGLNWDFYDGEKRRFIIMFLYKMGFKDAGTFLYKFNGTSFSTPFNFQTTNKGSGFCIYAGIPIKLFQLRDKQKK